MRKIPLYWFDKGGRFGNFGDELGPFIIKKLSGKEIYQIPIPRSSLSLLLAYTKGLIKNYYSLSIFPKVIKTLLLNGNYIISIGSIIGWGSGMRKVWGSGILYKNENIDKGKFLAVRGKYTQQRLKELGYNVPDVIGDPALLLPLVYRTDIKKSHRLGIVPHHSQFSELKLFANNDTMVIDLIDDIEKIIDKINCCEYIISTSLHGLIVAHAYNIPAVWYEYSKIKLEGENVKFLDYLSSVGIEEYTPLTLNKIEDFNVEMELFKFNKLKEYSLIKTDLSNIQKQLLKVAPFPVLNNYLK